MRQKKLLYFLQVYSVTSLLVLSPRTKGLFQTHTDRKRKPVPNISILDVVTEDRSSFSFDNILKIIKNSHDSCHLNNKPEDTQAYEHSLEKCISLTSVIQAQFLLLALDSNDPLLGNTMLPN